MIITQINEQKIIEFFNYNRRQLFVTEELMTPSKYYIPYKVVKTTIHDCLNNLLFEIETTTEEKNLEVSEILRKLYHDIINNP